jgi:hypothetical protein
MSFFVSGAVVLSAGAAAYSSNKASKQQAKGVAKGIEASSALAQQARDDVNRLFAVGAAQGRSGIEGAFNFYKQAAPQRMAPVSQGFQQGINVLGQGAQQANNAILGLPVDMNFTSQQVQQAPAGYLDQAQLTQVPMLGSANPEAEKQAAEDELGANAGGQQQNAKQPPSTSQLLNPLNYAKDPIGGAKAIVKKIESKDPARKLLKKLF